jgi:hypothetical protein
MKLALEVRFMFSLIMADVKYIYNFLFKINVKISFKMTKY